MFLETLAIAGAGIAAGWVWAKVFTRKPKPIVQYTTQEDVEALKEVNAMLGVNPSDERLPKRVPVIKWCGDIYDKGYRCPKCSAGWCNRNGSSCCDCELLPFSHYHLKCSGKVNGVEKVGCQTRFLMLASDVPTSVDPNGLFVEKLEEEPKPEPKKRKSKPKKRKPKKVKR